jgi:hypothetical protein
LYVVEVAGQCHAGFHVTCRTLVMLNQAAETHTHIQTTPHKIVPAHKFETISLLRI